jgi:uncharacterized protein YrzB (UPF0473 family)
MSDIEKNVNDEQIDESNIITLTDEETGEDVAFVLLDEAELDGKRYFALVEADDEEATEYVILAVTEDGDDLLLDSIEDDEEFYKVEEYFNDRLFSDVDYDA